MLIFTYIICKYTPGCANPVGSGHKLLDHAAGKFIHLALFFLSLFSLFPLLHTPQAQDHAKTHAELYKYHHSDR
jgi:hypothetical protein